MELRDYQKECIDTMKSYTGERALIVMATGLGKTVTFSEFLRYEAIENDRQCLILSHRDELVRNPLKYLDDMQCGVEIAEKHAKGYEKIISASVQSIVNRLNKFNPFAISTVVIDECHHSAAPTYRKIIDYFRSATVFGFTATAKRGDGIGLGVVFDDIIFERDLLWGIKHGFLCPIEGMVVRLKYSLESVKIINDDFSDNDLAKVMSGTAIGISEIYTKHAKGQTIIFAPSVSEAEGITRNINKTHGNIAKTITAQTKNRDKILNDFLHGKIKVLTNFAVLTEGVDLPCTETVIIAKPTAKSNPGAYAQMVGRGVRLHPGKTSCLVIDCVGISDIPICTAATLLGKDLPPPKKGIYYQITPTTGRRQKH